jgi:adenosine deaminase
LNSDDPAYFGGYMTENFRAVQSALDLSELELRANARNGFAASFMPDSEKSVALASFDSSTSLSS